MKPKGRPADCLGGVRHVGGVSLILALMWNVGTCRPAAKGRVQVGSPHENARTDAGHRGGVTRSNDEAPERGRSEGVASFRLARRSTGNGRNL